MSDPVHHLTSTYAVDDLRWIASKTAPFATVTVPMPSRLVDAAGRVELEWRNLRRDLLGLWPEDFVERIDALVDGRDHRRGAAMVVVQSADGTSFAETILATAPTGPSLAVGDAPAVLPIIGDRQRRLPHVVVTADRIGVDIVIHDGGSVVVGEHVVGRTEYQHPGHPGGWSQRRFRERSEQSWERNVTGLVETVLAAAGSVRAVLVAVAGETRARAAIAAAIADTHHEPPVEVVELAAGDAAGVVAESEQRVADLHARLQRQVLDRLQGDHGAVTGVDAVRAALVDGRVATLVAPESAPTGHHPPTPADLVVRDALRTAATVVVVPDLRDGVAALTRW